jgi:hypothetical protein
MPEIRWEWYPLVAHHELGNLLAYFFHAKKRINVYSTLIRNRTQNVRSLVIME